MNKLTRCAALAAPAASVLSACPSTRTPPSAITSDQATQLPWPQSSKPEAVIGLAFGGGVSKGFAHISTVRILKKNSVPIRVVTSTFAGSTVSSLYTSGMSSDRFELEAEILGRTDLVDLTLSASDFIKGEKLQNYINCKVGNRPIQQLPLKLATITTDLETGKAITFNRGNVGQTMRASASIPNMFQPAVIGNHKYVDGGLPQSVSVSTVKARGADLIIVVDISACPTKNVNQSFFSYLDQTLNIMSTSALHSEPGKAGTMVKLKVLELDSAGGLDQKNRTI